MTCIAFRVALLASLMIGCASDDNYVIDGTVTHQGTLIAGADVALLDANSSTIISQFTTDGAGEFEFKIDEPGDYTFVAKYGDSADPDVITAIETLTVTDDQSMELVLEGASQQAATKSSSSCSCQIIFWNVSWKCCTQSGYTYCYWGWGC